MPRVPDTRALQEYFDSAVAAGGDSPEGVGYRCAPVFESVQRALYRLLGDVAGLSVLDVGCGNGRMSSPLAKRAMITGADVSAGMCLAARRAGITPVMSLGSALPFTDGSFDVAICIEVLQVVPDAPAVVREMKRVVKPGGRVVISGPNAASMIRQLSHIAMTAGLLRSATGDAIGLPMLRTAHGFRELGLQAGLRPEREAATYFPLARESVQRRTHRLQSLIASNLLIAFARP